MRWPTPPGADCCVPAETPEGADADAGGMLNWGVALAECTGADMAVEAPSRVTERPDDMVDSVSSSAPSAVLPSPGSPSSRWLCAMPRSLSLTCNGHVLEVARMFSGCRWHTTGKDAQQ